MKINLKYVQAFKDRHGKQRHYFRRSGKRTVLPGEPTSQAFMDAYNTLLADIDPTKVTPKGIARAGSFEALIREYYGAPEYTRLRDSTKAEYRRYIEPLRDEYGTLQVTMITRRAILKIRDKHADRPRAADSYVEKLKILCRFAMDREYIKINPALGVKLLGGAGGTYEPWPRIALDRFLEQASPKHQLALCLLLYTGQRRGDVVKMAWQHYKNGVIEVKQSKTGKPLWIPAHKTLRAMLDGVKREHLMMLHTDHGNAFVPVYFGAWFNKEMTRLGLGGLQIHGLRKNATNELLEAGCTEAETAAITGQSLRMVAHYAKAVNQKRLAAKAVGKWEQS